MKNSKKFLIYACLPDVIKIYNENFHSSKKFKPYEIFGITDKNNIKKVIAKKWQNKNINTIERFKINTKCLLYKNFILKRNIHGWNKSPPVGTGSPFLTRNSLEKNVLKFISIIFKNI